MWHPPPITGDNLRLIVRNAPKGADIVVPPGEFEGPFIVDRPMRLAGQGDRPEATTLWTRRGPAIIVRSAGVSLANLNVELTLPEARQSDVVLWYAAGCQPDVQDAQIQGRIEEMGRGQSGGGWKLPDLIDLGDLRAKHSVTLPMLIQVPGPAQLSGELTNLYVQPARLPAGGEHLIRLGIPQGKLFKDTMLAGQLVIESGGETRAVWIIGRVLEEEFKAWVKDKIVLVGKSGRKYGFGPGMLLGREQLQGEPGADRIAERQAYIMKESSGVWSLIQPLPVDKPTEVDGRPLDVGRRQLLKGGEVIKIGSLELTVEANKTDLPISVDGTVDFGKLSARASMPPPTVKVQNNYKRNKWEGTLRSTVPWIQVPQPQVVCPGGKTVDVPVQLGAGLSSLPRQLINYTGALVLEGKGESWIISAQVDIDVEEGLVVEPTALDFGQVSDPLAVTPQRVRVRNVGTADWQGTVQVTVPWLVVDKTGLQCAAGGETTMEVRLAGEVTALPEGPNTAAAALKVEGQGLGAVVSARLHYAKPKVSLSVRPQSLDWGKVLDWRAAKSQAVQLHNTGDKDWQGKATSKVPWLEVTPATLSCPAQGKTDLTIRLTDRLQGLSEGEHKVSEAVRIEGEGLSFSILARLEVEAPRIQVDTTSIELILDDRSVLPRHTLRLQNRGGQIWSGTASSTLRWLEVSPTDITCPAGGQAAIDVTLNPQVVKIFRKPREVRVDDAVRIEGGGQPLLIGVRLEIKPVSELAPVSVAPPPTPEPVSPPPKDVTPPPELVVDFGKVYDWSGSLPTREIRLSNSQAQVMKGIVRSTLPWLEVTPSSFSCPPGQEVALTARLTEEGARLRVKEYDVADGVVIECGDKKHLVRTRLEIVEEAPPPPKPTISRPGALTVDFGTVSDWSGPLPAREIRLTNSQNRVMQGTVRSTVPWLEVTPSSFSCPPKQDVVLTAKLTEAGKGMRPKPYDVHDAVVIESGGKEHFVNAQLVVARVSPVSTWSQPVTPPPPPPEKKPEREPEKKVEPATDLGGLAVDFGTVSDWSGPLPTREIRLSNTQGQVMEGTVRSTLPWLEVTPASFSCAPGEDFVLTAKLTKMASRLRTRTYDVADAVVIECGGKKHLMNARLVVSKIPTTPRPPMRPPAPTTPGTVPEKKEAEVIPAPERPKASATLVGLAVDFGTVSDWSGTLPAREIRLTNTKAQVMKGTVRSTLPWLEVTPASFSCPSGGEVVLTVKLVAPPIQLRPKEYHVADALVIESGGKEHRVEARLVVAPGLPPLGPRTVVAPRGEVAGKARVDQAPKPEETKAAIPQETKTPKKPPRKLPEALVVEPTSLDMGSVSDWSGPFPAHKIELSNGLKTDWSGTARSTVPWLSVSPTKIDCPAGATATLKVRLTKRGAHLRPRTYAASDALIVEGGDQKLTIKVQVTAV